MSIMHRRLLAVRLLRTLFAALACTVATAGVARAQFTAPLVARLDGARDSAALSQNRWLGDVTSCGPFGCSQAAALSFEWDMLGPIGVIGEGTASHAGFSAANRLGTERRFDLSYEGRGFRMWIGRVAADQRNGLMAATTTTAGRFEYGVSARRGPFDAALSLGSGTIPVKSQSTPHLVSSYYLTLDSNTGVWDTVRTQHMVGGDSDSTVRHTPWTSAEARLSWTHRRLLLTAIVGTAAAVGRPRATWGGVQADAEIVRGLALSVGVGTGPALVLTSTPAARGTLSAGLRLTPDAFRNDHSSASAVPPAPAFVAEPAGPGYLKILIHVPNAAHVDLAGDCTAWQAVPMRHVDGTTWELVVAATPGVHHIDIRVDGGSWIAPPGLAAIDDDFMGQVGVFVAQ